MLKEIYCALISSFIIYNAISSQIIINEIDEEEVERIITY